MKKLVLAGLVCALGFGSINVQAKNNQAGAAIGGIIGAVVGADASNGDPGAIIVGAIGGAVIGSVIGESVDEESRSVMTVERARALERAERRSWRSPHFEGELVVLNTGNYQSYECRTYRSVIRNYSGRVIEDRTESTCYQSGSWQQVHHSLVNWR